MTRTASLQARRQKAAELNLANEAKSWRQISQDDYFGIIPFGTLERIAKTNGEYFPRKWAPLLGVKLSSPAHPRMKRLADMKPDEILSSFRLVDFDVWAKNKYSMEI
jgi:hypothetical protein